MTINTVRRPVVPIKIGGRVRNLHFTYNALAELEAQAVRFEGHAPTRAMIRAALWAGCIEETLDARGRETPDTPTLNEVGRWLDADDVDLPEITKKVFEALAVSKVPDRPTPAGRETSKPISSSPGASDVTTSDLAMLSSGL